MVFVTFRLAAWLANLWPRNRGGSCFHCKNRYLVTLLSSRRDETTAKSPSVDFYNEKKTHIPKMWRPSGRCGSLLTKQKKLPAQTFPDEFLDPLVCSPAGGQSLHGRPNHRCTIEKARKINGFQTFVFKKARKHMVLESIIFET